MPPSVIEKHTRQHGMLGAHCWNLQRTTESVQCDIELNR